MTRMAKTCFLTAMALASAAIMFASCEDKPITADQLPAEAKAYIQQQYPNQKIMLAEEDYGMFTSSYEVKLDNGIELTFDSDGKLIDFDD